MQNPGELSLIMRSTLTLGRIGGVYTKFFPKSLVHFLLKLKMNGYRDFVARIILIMYVPISKPNLPKRKNKTTRNGMRPAEIQLLRVL